MNCPKCGSNDCSKATQGIGEQIFCGLLQIGGALLGGAVGNRISTAASYNGNKKESSFYDYQCNKCGHKW